ncbi:hypothetical protein [Geodermatophilus sabuli]|uniref:Uncharacterized protein n=1 Tax=Geodermatophilus sabuli TaxID=1564158 RepID=A0A285ECG8_9ACTN|nr:hypothetical protein [Geodermatophilus sabuli]MBB3083589.1 hypothetical protein [Geodermatophilus sabuli]SNX96690.1 hypothetical protein SAMN06893097_10524 [Geodermatophilus sabuli]
MPVLTRTANTAVLFALLACAGVAGAAPALAVDDPTRPDARVTHGPSCRPGGVVLEVTGGAVAFAVTLTTTRLPAGEDAAEVHPGQVVVLATGDVDWGETIDPGLAYTALDGSGTSYVDALDGYSFTRPAAEDCAAIAPPTAAAAVPSPALDAGTVPEVVDPEIGVVPMPVPGPGATTPADELQVAAAPTSLPRPDGGVALPVVVAGIALLGAGAGLAAVPGRRARRAPGPPSTGSA